MSRRRSGQHGFTLIEVLIVVVLGILAAIAVPMHASARESAKDAAAQSNVRNMATHLVALDDPPQPPTANPASPFVTPSQRPTPARSRTR